MKLHKSKSYYKSGIRATNSVADAKPTKGIVGKGGKIGNAEIAEWMYKNELEARKEGKA